MCSRSPLLLLGPFWRFQEFEVSWSWYQKSKTGSPFLRPLPKISSWQTHHFSFICFSLLQPPSNKNVRSQMLLLINTQQRYYQTKNETRHGVWVWNSQVKIVKFNPLSRSPIGNPKDDSATNFCQQAYARFALVFA